MGVCASATPTEALVTYPMTVEKLSNNVNCAEKLAENRPTDPELVTLVDSLGGWAMNSQNNELLEAFRTDERYKSVVNMICSNGGTPLVLSAYAGDIDCCKTLIGNGAAIDTFCLQGTAPLFTAAQHNHMAVVEYLISKGAVVDLINKPEDEDITALHVAAHYGRKDVMQYLISKGADVTRKKLGGATALWLAAQEGHLDIVKLLVEKHKMSPEQPRDDGKPPIFIAAQRGQDEMVRYLAVELHVPIAAVDGTGLTPLHAASMFGHGDTCNLLCELVPLEKRGEFVNAETVDGYTALELREAHARDAPEGVHAVLLQHDAEDREAAKENEKLVDVSYKPRIMEDPIVVE